MKPFYHHQFADFRFKQEQKVYVSLYKAEMTSGGFRRSLRLLSDRLDNEGNE